MTEEIRSDDAEGADDARLHRRASKGVAWLTGSQLLGQGFAMLSRIVLARLLLPADFGLVGMAAVVIAFLDLLTGLGIPAAVIQAKELDETTKSSAFWATLAQGIALAAVGVLASPWIAEGFDEPRLTPILRVLLAGGAILAPLSLLESLLSRGLDFKIIAVRRVVGHVVGGVLAVGLALGGAGVWSLVAGRLATSVTAFVLLFAVSRWKPKRVFSVSALRSLASFGAGVTVAGVLHALNRQMPAIVIGRVLGAEALGVFVLAQQIVLLPLQYLARPVAAVLFPLFSRLQDRRAELTAAFERWQFWIVAAGMLPAAVAAAVAPPAVEGVLGETWAAAVPLLEVLAIPAAGRLVVSLVSPAVRAVGRVHAIAVWTAAALMLQAGGVLAGAQLGLLAATLGWSAGLVVSAFVGLYLAKQAVGLGWRSTLRPLLLTAVPVTAAVAATRALLHVLRDVPPLGAAGVGAVLATSLYLVGLRLTAQGEWVWLRDQALARLRRKRRLEP